MGMGQGRRQEPTLETSRSAEINMFNHSAPSVHRRQTTWRWGALSVLALILLISACSGKTEGASSSVASTVPTAAAQSSVTPHRTTATTTPAPPPPPFTITCYIGASRTFISLEQVWSTDEQFSLCSVNMSPTYKPTPNDLAAVELYRQFVPSETTPGALGAMLAICAERFATEEDVLKWEPPVIQGALLLCGAAPHAGLLQARASKAIIDDGTYVIGQSMAPGTWSTKPSVRDCYWERTTGAGDIIDNNFVSFAPNGVTVTIRSSDGGFISRGCGVWHKIK